MANGYMPKCYPHKVMTGKMEKVEKDTPISTAFSQGYLMNIEKEDQARFNILNNAINEPQFFES
jgi:hypothetical protein